MTRERSARGGSPWCIPVSRIHCGYGKPFHAIASARSPQNEIRQIASSEIRIAGRPYSAAGKPADTLRVVFLFPYGHAYSLMCNGPMSLYDLINTRPDVPAVAERALVYDCLVPHLPLRQSRRP
jgi:hypothetical protein